MIGGLLATVGLLLLNALFVALEFALIASRRTKLEPLAEAGSLRARLALKASHELNLELAAAQLGVTVASLGLGYIAEPTISHLFVGAFAPIGALPSGLVHGLSFVLALAIVSLLHMIVGEMVPKNLVLADPERSLLWLAIPNKAYTWLFRPVVRSLNAVANAGVRLFGVEPRDEIDTIHNASELGHLVAASRSEGLLGEFEHDLLAGALGMAHRPVTEVMVPWSRVATMPQSATVAEYESALNSSGFTRLPVIDPSGKPLGFLHAKDLLSMTGPALDRPVPLGRLRRMLVLDSSQTLEDALLSMQWARVHLGAVRNGEHFVGLVALEDILEELVGDIRDESDRV